MKKLTMLLGGASMAIAAPALAADIVIEVPNWPLVNSTVHILKVAIEQILGLEVELQNGTNPIVFEAMDSGATYVHPEVRLPDRQNLHDTSVKEKGCRVHSFAFFGAVPQSILYDNDRCLVARILPDGARQRSQRCSAMLSHYVVKDLYRRPGKGNDKGAAEGLVGYGRRNFGMPIPSFPDWNAFNAHPAEQCRKRQGDVLRGHKASIGERLQVDLAAMRDLPATPFPRPAICKAARSHRHRWCAIAATTTRCRSPTATAASDA